MRDSCRMLLVSDVHESFGFIEQLSSHLQSTPQPIDVCCISGDLTNIHHDIGQQTEDRQGFHTVLQRIRDAIGQAVPAFYVPGNHDPAEEFAAKGSDSGYAHGIHNLHATRLVLKDFGLTVYGLGGSVPGRFQHNTSLTAFPGFPYASEDQVRLNLESLRPQMNQDYGYVFVTHCGPSNSGTSIDNSHPKEADRAIEMGSEAIYEFVYRQLDSRPLLHIHGHCHDGVGSSQIGGIPVVNPGSLQHGRFATVDLVRQDQAWRV
ncbi:hypothetical protein HDV03_005503, partial [Kappamyces sp. JEL0829]